MRELLARAGLAEHMKPVLLVVDGDRVLAYTGWALRWRLARLVGVRRAADIARLAVAEGGARLQAGTGLSRRGAIGAALAGLGAAVAGAALRGSAAHAGPTGGPGEARFA